MVRRLKEGGFRSPAWNAVVSHTRGLIAQAPRGISIGSTMQQSTCLSPFCGTQTPYTVPACPACGRPAFDDEELARRGRHVLQLGAILASVMAAVIWMLAANLAAALDGRFSRHPAASAENARLVIVLLGAMLLMGLALIVSGIKMIRARSSLWSTRLAIILFVSALLAIGAFIVRAYLL